MLSTVLRRSPQPPPLSDTRCAGDLTVEVGLGEGLLPAKRGTNVVANQALVGRPCADPDVVPGRPAVEQYAEAGLGRADFKPSASASNRVNARSASRRVATVS